MGSDETIPLAWSLIKCSQKNFVISGQIKLNLFQKLPSQRLNDEIKRTLDVVFLSERRQFRH